MADWLDRYRGPLTAILLVVLFGGGALWWERRPAGRELVIAPPATQPAGKERWLTVDVAGAVASPGIYTLREGARVGDAIVAAGGETADADLAAINRAAKVRDEQQVRVPRLRTAPATAEGAAATAPQGQSGTGGDTAAAMWLDINSASAAQLESLPGIGTVIAQRIIAFREQNGPFQRVEDLRDLKLVNGATFEKIKALVVVR